MPVSSALTWLKGVARTTLRRGVAGIAPAGAVQPPADAFAVVASAPAADAIQPDSAPPAPLGFRIAQGTQEGWLKLLDAPVLFELVQADKAIGAMWRQSGLSQAIWQRDLQPALQRYAEYVQLLPASEAHHHAHVGGLLAHTIEMLLAAMTWRNGLRLPEGATVEDQADLRDEWTYVVFFAALLHDIAKIMTDLRVSWRVPGTPETTVWAPLGGPLQQVVGIGRAGEYMVEFAPKTQRDYQAHSRLAVMLLQQVAPIEALGFLARRPSALEALTRYLSGQDRDSLVARTVAKADKASAQRALLSGSRARFTTANSVPLIDLLMLAMRDLLRSGTALPLNRSGAAGWVYDGSVWFVAKRLADTVRKHIQERAPDEGIPGESKNDRLFDTWQEYGAITLNPQSGQAIWHVNVVGGPEAAAREGGNDQEDDPDSDQEGADRAAYSHSLSMLRFALDKLFDDPSQYPSPMQGRIEVRAGRGAASAPITEALTPAEILEGGRAVQPAKEAVSGSDPEAPAGAQPKVQDAAPAPVSAAGKTAAPKTRSHDAAPGLKAPSFNRPKPGAGSAPANVGGAAAQPKVAAPPAAVVPPKPVPSAAVDAPPRPIVHEHGAMSGLDPVDGFDVDDDWLDSADDASAFKAAAASKPGPKPQRTIASKPLVPPQAKGQRLAAPKPIAAPSTARSAAVSAPATARAMDPAAAKAPAPLTEPPVTARASDKPKPKRTLLAAPGAAPSFAQGAAPVVLQPFLPALPHEVAATAAEPPANATAFMSWLQQQLACRQLKYNETGAMVHFVPQGMALVSPAIFKEFAREHWPEEDPAAKGLQIQREVLKAGWHMVGPGKINILSYQVLGRGGVAVSKIAAVVFVNPDRWVVPVPPSNPVLSLMTPS